MRATDFESRHQTALHQLIVLAAFLTYVADPDDIVWRFIKSSTGDVRLLERAIFAVATALFGIAAYLCTRSRTQTKSSSPRQRYIGEFLYAIALGSLAPLAGFLILGAGEAIRLLRLALRKDEIAPREPVAWPQAFRLESVKWGLFLTMIVFTITLIDRVAEVLAGASVLLWLTLNARRAGRPNA